jgi:hypothetical protein
MRKLRHIILLILLKSLFPFAKGAYLFGEFLSQ